MIEGKEGEVLDSEEGRTTEKANPEHGFFIE